MQMDHELAYNTFQGTGIDLKHFQAEAYLAPRI